MEKEFIITFEKMAFGGEAVGHLPDGRAVFTPFVLPGESARILITEEKPTYCRAQLVALITPSAGRIDAHCPWFTICGGCQLQHLPYEEQLALKKMSVIEQLQRVAHITQPPVMDVLASPQTWHYRNHVQFHLADDGSMGFFDVSNQAIVAVQTCPIVDEEILSAWQQIEMDSQAAISRVMLRQGADGDQMVIFEGMDDALPAFAVDFPISAVHINADGRETVLSGDSELVFVVRDVPFRVSPQSFFQVNSAQAGVMLDEVLKLLPERKLTQVLECYSGVGLFSYFLAAQADELIAIESSASACGDFVVNLDVFDHVSLYQAEVEDVLPALTIAPDLIVLDPPRSGVKPLALTALLKLDAQQIIYISCNPSTLARDVQKILLSGYQLEKVIPLDMFPQTYHVESIALFTRMP